MCAFAFTLYADFVSKSFLESSQDEERVSYCRKLNKRDGQLDFSLSAEEIECRFRVLQVGLEPGFCITTPALKSVNYVCQKKS